MVKTVGKIAGSGRLDVSEGVYSFKQVSLRLWHLEEGTMSVFSLFKDIEGQQ